jgi:hypothetical protein
MCPAKTKTKTMQTVIEYEVRFIDAHGDAVEVEQFATLKEAEDCAARKALPDGAALAWAIERKTQRWYRNGSGKRAYVLLSTGGNPIALEAGNWVR